MTISDELTKLNTNLTDSYTAVSNKGGTLPASENFDNLPNAINSITELKGETKTVTPTTSQQTITPSSGKNGITQVTVNAVTSSIDSDIVAGNIKSGVNILGVNGTVTELAGETRTVSLTSSSSSGQTFTPSSGKNGITSITVKANNQARTVTPSTSSQSLTVNSGYSGNGTITVNAVTSAIDSNIQPQFIRNGVQILGITGEYGEPLPSPQVVCSDNTTWYINTDGELYGCGRNSYGNQGSGDTTNVTTFTKRADNVKQIACSQYTTWYINESGELYGCGNGQYGQQGNNGTSNVTTFTKRADNVKQVACSTISAWYINSSGELFGCGSSNYGQQGNNGTSNVTTFTKRADNVKQVACSQYTTWYINNSGELYGCGYNYNGQQGSGTSGSSANVLTFTKRADNVVQIACTDTTTWYINSSGELYGCGNNLNSQQGSGNTSDVKTFTKRADNVVQIAIDGTTWYINSSGELFGCGSSSRGQQGNNGTSNVTTFTKRADNVKQVACSSYTTWYLNENGELYGCGNNCSTFSGSTISGQQSTNRGTYITTFTKRADNVKQVACSSYTTWHTTQNDVYGCGRGDYGQQGNGSTSSVLTFTKRN